MKKTLTLILSLPLIIYGFSYDYVSAQGKNSTQLEEQVVLAETNSFIIDGVIYKETDKVEGTGFFVHNGMRVRESEIMYGSEYLTDELGKVVEKTELEMRRNSGIQQAGDGKKLDNYKPLESILPVNAIGGNLLEKYINFFFEFIIIFGGVMAVLHIVFIGLRYMTSGGNVFEKSETNRKLILISSGLLLLLLSYIILNTIDPNLTTLKI